MTRLEQLVAGAEVEWRTLGEVATLRRGRVILKKHIAGNEGPYPVYGSQTVNEGEIGRIGTYDFDQEAITWTTDGARAGTVFYRDGRFSISHLCGLITIADREQLDYKYLYHWLSIEAQSHVNAGMGISQMMIHQLAKIPVPIPPLAIQVEIAHILDVFMKSDAELEHELARELSARRKQYAYYRDRLLTFGEDEVEWKTLGEIGSICMCKRVLKRETASAGDVPFYKIGTFGREADAYISQKLYEELAQKSPPPRKGEVLLSVAGTIGRAVIHDGAPAYFQDSNIVWISHDESQVLNRFLYHYYQVARWTVDDSGIIARLYNWRLAAYPVPIPPLARQAEIADVLDRLHALSHSLMDELPAELRARRRQYEHYREQLLSFPGANSTHK